MRRWRIFVALSLLAAHAGLLAHALVVRHEACAAHGEAIHGEPAGEGTATRVPEDRAEPARRSIDRHDHCALACSSRPFVRPAALLLLRASRVSRALVPTLGGDEAPLPWLSLAPKHSPPAGPV